MKKSMIVILALASCLTLTGCFDKKEEAPVNTQIPAVKDNGIILNDKPEIENNKLEEKDNSETDSQEQEGMEAIKNALKDEEWVKKNVMLQKTCFGEDASYNNQELTFLKLGKDRVIVQAFAYEEDFGIANTIISYQDGKVVTFGLPTIEEPAHPGHAGYGVVSKDGILVEKYMHMGYYIDNYYQILDNELDLIASFEASEYSEDGVLLENEAGDVLVDYHFVVNGEEEKGRTTFDAFEKMVMNYMNDEMVETIEIPLTTENIDLYLK